MERPDGIARIRLFATPLNKVRCRRDQGDIGVLDTPSSTRTDSRNRGDSLCAHTASLSGSMSIPHVTATCRLQSDRARRRDVGRPTDGGGATEDIGIETQPKTSESRLVALPGL